MFNAVNRFLCLLVIAFGSAYSSEQKLYEINGSLFDSHRKTNGPKAVVSVIDNSNKSKVKDFISFDQDKKIFVLKDSLQWIEIQKNTTYSLCLDEKLNGGHWTAKNISVEKKDSCILLYSGSSVKSAGLEYVSASNEKFVFNILVGMKYLDLSKKEHLLGYIGTEKRKQTRDTLSRYLDIGLKYADGGYPDSLRYERFDKILAVDEFKVTECEFVNVLWDSIPGKLLPEMYENQNYWINKKRSMKKGVCDTHDSAATVIPPYYALIYANRRSLRDGLAPAYDFEFTHDWKVFKLFDDGSFGVKREPLSSDNQKEFEYVLVRVNSNSNGYRLPYYEEWMAFARGGHAYVEYIWGNESSADLASKYAWFGIQDPDDPLKKINLKNPYERNWLKKSCGMWIQKSRPVGMLKPNDYGLYDISGLVCESVMLSGKSIFDDEVLTCKGGFLSDSLGALNLGSHCDYKASNDFVYRGLRLVRKIK